MTGKVVHIGKSLYFPFKAVSDSGLPVGGGILVCGLLALFGGGKTFNFVFRLGR